MSASVCAFDWKAKARDVQTPEPMTFCPRNVQVLPVRDIAGRSCTAVLSDAARHSGLEDQEIAEELGIHPSYMSRFLRAVGRQWMERLVDFMRITKSVAPLQWMAHQVGYELVEVQQ